MPLNKFVPCCGPFIFIRETGLSRLRQRYTVLFYKEGEREQNSAFCGPRSVKKFVKNYNIMYK